MPGESVRPLRGRPEPIPLTILTGFLGAGKTTLLNRLLRDPLFADTLVIVNEFGEVALDHLLVEAVDDDMVLLSAGCLCCTVRGDLVGALEDLLRRRDNGRIAPFRRVVIETTGLADPAPVIGAVLYHPYLSLRFAIGSVVALSDASAGDGVLARHAEARRQVAVADLVLLGKTDLATADDRAALARSLRALAPAVALRDVGDPEVPRLIAAGGAFGLDGKADDLAGWLREEVSTAHSGRIRTAVLTSDRPVAAGTLDAFLDLLRATFGPRILRIKGLVELADRPGQPVVVQGVAHVVHVPASLPDWPDDDRRSRLVVIAEDVPTDAIVRLWHAFTGQATPDVPDAAALLDNPLAPATLRG